MPRHPAAPLGKTLRASCCLHGTSMEALTPGRSRHLLTCSSLDLPSASQMLYSLNV